MQKAAVRGFMSFIRRCGSISDRRSAQFDLTGGRQSNRARPQLEFARNLSGRPYRSSAKTETAAYPGSCIWVYSPAVLPHANERQPRRVEAPSKPPNVAALRCRNWGGHRLFYDLLDERNDGAAYPRITDTHVSRHEGKTIGSGKKAIQGSGLAVRLCL
jgi:hypothetical protein